MNTPNIILPWVEKYRPISLDDIESHTDILRTIKLYIKNGSIPHMLFYGPPGTGKTTTILACARKLYGDSFRIMTLELNASDDRGINMVRNRIDTFASTYGFSEINSQKLIILDEADAMTNEAQHALQKIMDMYSDTTQFCIICNYISKIVPEILSRCTRFRFPPLPSKIVIKYIKKITKEENLMINKSGIRSIMLFSQGDMRQVLNIIQSCASTGNLISEDKICEILSKPSETQIHDIINVMVGELMKERYLFIKEYLHSTGISIFDLIADIADRILDNPNLVPKDKFKDIIGKLADIENRSFSDANQSVQIIAFVSCFN